MVDSLGIFIRSVHLRYLNNETLLSLYSSKMFRLLLSHDFIRQTLDHRSHCITYHFELHKCQTNIDFDDRQDQYQIIASEIVFFCILTHSE